MPTLKTLRAARRTRSSRLKAIALANGAPVGNSAVVSDPVKENNTKVSVITQSIEVAHKT